MVLQAGGQPFQLQYNDPRAKAMRGGLTASTGSNLTTNPPAFDPRNLQSTFIKQSTNALKSGFTSQEFDPSEVQGLINKAGTNSNFGSSSKLSDPKDQNNVQAQEFLKKYQEGVQRQLIMDPVDANNLGPFMSKAAPYQAEKNDLTNVAKPFPGSESTKIE